MLRAKRSTRSLTTWGAVVIDGVLLLVNAGLRPASTGFMVCVLASCLCFLLAHSRQARRGWEVGEQGLMRALVRSLAKQGDHLPVGNLLQYGFSNSLKRFVMPGYFA